MHIQVVLFDGFDPLDVIAPYEVLYAGGSASDGAVTVELVTAEGPREVISGTGGLSLRAAGALDLERADMLLVPGASGRVGEPGEVPEEEVGAGEWKQDEFIPVLLGRTLSTELPALLKQAMDDPDITVATVCGGSLVLAMAGLLEGRHATTHHLGLDVLDATGAHAVRARVVDDGDLITAAGVTSGLDLGLYLLERELGPRIAHAVEELFAHERRGTVWRAQGMAPATL
ncbi:DJ-1/PfpI family protein [Streptomyces sp. TRM S81-3]|uniref:DJ-1/PfpI family protein n=1 Tax=Streptomyces griseicoloratus TaxID=2752516 RepID=A0A926L7U1_9ACTN|nr:DJ-1/PfpI family protein [Streptomyces griseicoloratus]MBD0421956.1 DJ-1/PfpI family protein [Streptomyces griseicoloratus]